MKLLTPDEVAEILSVRQPKVRQWLNNGTLRGWKAGRIWRVKEEDLMEFIEANMNRKTKKPINEDLPSKDPVLEVIGSISDEIIFTSRDIDKELYGETIHDI